MAQNLSVRKGRCINVNNCIKADSGEVQEVNPGDDFICSNPDCEGGLIDVSPNGNGNTLKRILIIAGIAIVLGVCGYFIVSIGIPLIFKEEPVILTNEEIEEEVVSETWHPITPERITINKPVLFFEKAGETEQLNAIIHPDSVKDKNRKVIWTSSDTVVATVNSTGFVTAVSWGSALISAYTGNGLSASCYVTVGNEVVNATAISIDKTTLSFKAKTTEQLTATVKPENATNKVVTWKSDNEAVAKVDTNGLVAAVANGKAVISAITNNGLTATCSVQVQIITQPTPEQLNYLLGRIRNSDDRAIDEIRRVLGNGLRVEGATNISNVQQLITDVSNGSRYRVIRINTNDDGKPVSIVVSKQ